MAQPEASAVVAKAAASFAAKAMLDVSTHGGACRARTAERVLETVRT